MSFFTSLKTAAKSAVSETSRAFQSAKSTPTQIQCTGCVNTLGVPSALFDWKCQEGHENKYMNARCTLCAHPQPKKRPEPQIKCDTCGSIVNVPFTNAEKQLREAARAAKSQYTHLKSKPATFHCTHCNKLLMVPTGAWGCNTCTTINAQEIASCTSCGQKKSEQKVMCGVCGRSTTIPSMNIMDTIGSEFRSLGRDSSKVYYDLRKAPYVTCTRCSAHVPIPKAKATKMTQIPATSSIASTTSVPSSSSSSGSQYQAAAPPTEEELKSIHEMEMEMESHHSIKCTSCDMEIPYIPPRRGNIVLPDGERRFSQPGPVSGPIPVPGEADSRRSSHPMYPSSADIKFSQPISQPTSSGMGRKLTPSEIEDVQPGLSVPVSLPPKETQIERLEKISDTVNSGLQPSKTSTATTDNQPQQWHITSQLH